MKILVICTAIGASLTLLSAISYAAAPANAPAGTTGLCKDGSYYSGPTKKGACKGHKGVKDWYAEPAAAATPAPAAHPAATAAAAAPAGSTGLCKDGTYYSGPTKKGACKGHKGVKDWYGAPAAAAATAPATAAPPTPTVASPATSPAPKVAAAPGGAAGKVWVNNSTKVYHCPGDKWYGKTKEGEYMPEAEATAHGFRPDHGKTCK
jgi:hypothetical protein